ncbi:type I-E CRISPR-associated protein Cse1/CasA [Nocardiopsis sp. NPDC050513]|uniref:type I-E CRISPR-associated protein Cse1/CasA n=1 Tax=Nocardiopsis sp. NPDC050513 TaxID=3364338 RepID=UPI0037A90F4C
MCNLVDDKWLPVQPFEGVLDRVSLRTGLLEAEKFSNLVFPAPTLLPAVLRQVLLPVVIDAIGSPRSSSEWRSWFDRGCFSDAQRERLEEYLDEHARSFDLFSEKRPFAQVGGLKTEKGETKSSSLLVSSIASGNNVPLFSGMTEADTLALEPAEAAWWLLHTHCWDTAAIKSGAEGDPQAAKGKTTGNPTGPLGQLGVIIPLGRTLYETLLLNLPPRDHSPDSFDRPQWRADEVDTVAGSTPVSSPASPRWSLRPELGLMDLLTWQSRRIRLIPEETPDGLRVTQVVLCAGDRLSRAPQNEPHTAWSWTSKPRKGQQQWRPRRHRPGRAIWQGLESLLAVNLPADPEEGGSPETEVTSDLLRALGELRIDGALPDDYPMQIVAAGMVYGNQSAVVESAIADRLPLPLAALASGEFTQDLVRDLARQANTLATALNRLHSDLRRLAGGDPVPWDKGDHPGTVFLHALDPLVRRALRGIQEHSEDDEALEAGMTAWEGRLWQIAEQHAQRLLSAAPASPFSGVEVDNRRYSATTAERAFRSKLYSALPKQAEVLRTRSQTQQGG